MKSAKENLLQQQDSEVDNIHRFSLKPINHSHPLLPAVVVDFTSQLSESFLSYLDLNKFQLLLGLINPMTAFSPYSKTLTSK